MEQRLGGVEDGAAEEGLHGAVVVAVVVLDRGVGCLGRLRHHLLQRDLGFGRDAQRRVKHVPQQRLRAGRGRLHTQTQYAQAILMECMKVETRYRWSRSRPVFRRHSVNTRTVPAELLTNPLAEKNGQEQRQQRHSVLY